MYAGSRNRCSVLLWLLFAAKISNLPLEHGVEFVDPQSKLAGVGLAVYMVAESKHCVEVLSRHRHGSSAVGGKRPNPHDG